MKPAGSKHQLSEVMPLPKQKNTVNVRSTNPIKEPQFKIRSESNNINVRHSSDKEGRPLKNGSKMNSIVELSRHEPSQLQQQRPISQQRKRQQKSIERLLVNKNSGSKSIAEQSKDLQESRLMRVKEMSMKQKQIGLVWMHPQHDTLEFEELEMTDSVYEKYFEMIRNDSDTIFVMNAVPEIKPFKSEPEQNKVDFFLSNKMSRISGQFSQLTSQKVISILKTRPSYLDTKQFKIHNHKLILSTKWKVVINIGFFQYITEPSRTVITRIYLSKIYRKMNYLGYVYVQILTHLFSKYQGMDRISVFLHDRNLGSVKFMKFLGGKIERIFTDSTNQKVDYYQEFVCKKKDFLKGVERLEH